MTVSQLLGKFEDSRTIQCELYDNHTGGYSGVFNVDEWDETLESEWKNAYITGWDIVPDEYCPTLEIRCTR